VTSQPRPLVRTPRRNQFADGQREGGTAPGDAVLGRLEIANLARAVIDGGLGARWELGAAVGRALCRREGE